MFFLSPVKILMVLAVALVVLGPDKLPAAARKVGGLWSDLRKMRQRLEQEVRGSFPDLPPTHELQRMARSPLSYLDQLTKTDEVAAPEYAAPITFTIPGVAPPEPVTVTVIDRSQSPLVLDEAQLN